MRASPESRSSDGLIWGLQRRLLVLLFLPLGLVGLVSVYFHYQSAGTAALQQDQQLLRLVPMLADSVVVTLPRDAPRPIDIDADPGLALLLAPPVDEFLKEREGYAGYGVMDANGRLLVGDRWLPTVLPTTEDAEFLSVVESGITYRVVAQRSPTAAGELIIMLADGSDGRQQWLDTVLLRVVLPAALPFIFTGLRLGIGIGWVLVIVVEMLAVKGGIGYAMWTAYQFVRIDLIIAAMFTIGILGLVTDRLLLWISRRLLRWNVGLRAR